MSNFDDAYQAGAQYALGLLKTAAEEVPERPFLMEHPYLSNVLATVPLTAAGAVAGGLMGGRTGSNVGMIGGAILGTGAISMAHDRALNEYRGNLQAAGLSADMPYSMENPFRAQLHQHAWDKKRFDERLSREA